jgi:dolichyl-phosphate-mannose-protein mannosyltransferase
MKVKRKKPFNATYLKSRSESSRDEEYSGEAGRTKSEASRYPDRKVVGRLIDIIREYKRQIVICLLLFAGLMLRLYFVDKYINFSGDLLLYADWGRKTVILGFENFYRGEIWEYAPPNYPPIINLIYSFAFRVYEHRYYFAQLHNAVFLPPAAFLRYFDTYGYYFMLKLPGILADLGLSLFAYWGIFRLTKNNIKALLGMSLLLFNPVLIFISSVWGQYDSLIALFALISFALLISNKPLFAIPLLVASLYIKPNWLIFLPLYVFAAFMVRVNIKKAAAGVVAGLVLVYLVTLPFAREGVIGFSEWLFTERILATLNAGGKASISAFNLHTLFLDYDISPDTSPILGLPANILGILLFSAVYLFALVVLFFSKDKLKGTMAAIFTITLGSYLFMTNMLERYFFAGFVPMVVLMFASPKLLLAGIVLNFTLFLNIIYAFFRRTTGAIADPFNANNFLLMRAVSLFSLSAYIFYIFMFFKDIKSIIVKRTIAKQHGKS